MSLSPTTPALPVLSRLCSGETQTGGLVCFRETQAHAGNAERDKSG